MHAQTFFFRKLLRHLETVCDLYWLLLCSRLSEPSQIFIIADNWEMSGTRLMSALSAVRLRPEPMPPIKVDQVYRRQEEPFQRLASFHCGGHHRQPNEAPSENGIIRSLERLYGLDQ